MVSVNPTGEFLAHMAVGLLGFTTERWMPGLGRPNTGRRA